MSAAMQLINPQLTPAETADGQLTHLASFEVSLEQRLRRALEYASQLEAEVRTLRKELAGAERSLAHKEVLLRNAVLREQELRTELVKGIC